MHSVTEISLNRRKDNGIMSGYEEIKKNEEILAYLRKADKNLEVLGYTEHSAAHTTLVAERAAHILDVLGYSEHEKELVKIAGFMHDIGNAVNRKNHAEYGALLAETILRNTDLDLDDRVTIVSAIGHHDETTGGARDAVSAALIIADKTDVRRSRVRPDETNFDIHDRVNYAVTDNRLNIDVEKKKITLEIKVDENICTMYEYFDIFLGRMMMSKAAAEFLKVKFSLVVNGSKVL